MCQRLTDREMQILQVAIKYAMLYANVSQSSYSYLDVTRGVIDWLGFEVSEEDVKILCGPQMMGGVNKQNP